MLDVLIDSKEDIELLALDEVEKLAVPLLRPPALVSGDHLMLRQEAL